MYRVIMMSSNRLPVNHCTDNSLVSGENEIKTTGSKTKSRPAYRRAVFHQSIEANRTTTCSFCFDIIVKMTAPRV